MAISLVEQEWQDGPVYVKIGDVRARLADLGPESVQCVVTSPPYWGLRDYHVTGQIGAEEVLEDYIANLVRVFREVGRVLRDDGTLWLNMGDAYSSSPPGNKTRGLEKWASSGLHGSVSERYAATLDESVSMRRSTIVRGKRIPRGGGRWGGGNNSVPELKAKDLIGLPWMLAFALRSDGWYLRSDIIWSKPNPMPESVQDRPTKAHEYLFLLTKAERYFYDADAIRTPLQPKTFTTFGTVRHDPGDGSGLVKSENFGRDLPVRRPRLKDKQRGHSRRHAGFNDRWDLMSREEQQLAGANARSVWEIATQPYPEAHFATFPEALVEPCILAGSAEGDTVLDPFAGSGTTLAVARRLGRKAIGIELQPDYLPLIQKRVTEAAMPLLEAIESA